MRAREVTTPSGERWRVGRLWAPRIGGERTSRRLRRRFRSTAELATSADSGCALDIGEGIIAGILVFVAVILFLVFVLPLIVVTLELLIVLLIVLLGIGAKVVFRRPWVVEAEALDGRRAGRLLAWRIVGWRASGQQVVDVARGLEAGIDLPPGAHEGRARARPGG